MKIRINTISEKTNEIIPEIETDLERLEQIGRRFSKMGSKSDLSDLNQSRDLGTDSLRSCLFKV